MTPSDIFSEFRNGFEGRKFSAGLLMAFIDFFLELKTPDLELSSFDEFLENFPRKTKTAAGKNANTLIVQLEGDKTLGLRPFYNAIELFFRSEQKRFDYPACAPHATQAWQDYRPWLDSLVTFDAVQLHQLRSDVSEFVLQTLKNQEFDPSSVKRDAPLFKMLLEHFDLRAAKREPSGAAFQGVVFGFLRADNPHLQIEIDKVRTGSKRIQRIADIDAWEGSRLAISAEAKHYVIQSAHVNSFEAFANEIGKRGAIGIVAGEGFGEGVREKIEELGLQSLGLEDMTRIVTLWDPMKQRTAIASFMYYVDHVEVNSSLTERVKHFLKQAEQDFQRGTEALANASTDEAQESGST